jgi:hypothetical protein
MAADETGFRTAGFWGIRLGWLVISNSVLEFNFRFPNAFQLADLVSIELRELV